MNSLEKSHYIPEFSLFLGSNRDYVYQVFTMFTQPNAVNPIVFYM